MAIESIRALPQAVEALGARAQQYNTYNNYYAGRHRPVLSSDKWQNAFGLRFQGFRDNLCPSVVNAVADRLQVTGFDVEMDEEPTGPKSETKDPRSKAAMLIWKRNRMDRTAGHVHLEALRTGDAYVMVWPDPTGLPRLHYQQAAEVTVSYSEEEPDVLEWAAKGWFLPDEADSHKKKFRLNLYFPDRIEKYITADAVDVAPKGLAAYVQNPGDGELWPLPNPYDQVPVFHFANDTPCGAFGASELHDVIPLQDGLNKAMCDLLIAMEFVSLPQRWMTGEQPEIDDATGAPKQKYKPGVDNLWMLANDLAKTGQFPEANLTYHLNAISEFRAEIARVSGTPLHYMMLLGGQPPSGEALKTLEARLIKKVLDRQISFGNAWEDALSFALKIQGQADVRFNATWTDPAPKSELEHAQTLEIKSRLGVSRPQILTELDYTKEQIAKMEAQKLKEDQQMFDQQMALAAAKPQGPPRTGGAPQNAG